MGRSAKRKPTSQQPSSQSQRQRTRASPPEENEQETENNNPPPVRQTRAQARAIIQLLQPEAVSDSVAANASPRPSPRTRNSVPRSASRNAATGNSRENRPSTSRDHEASTSRDQQPAIGNQGTRGRIHNDQQQPERNRQFPNRIQRSHDSHNNQDGGAPFIEAFVSPEERREMESAEEDDGDQSEEEIGGNDDQAYQAFESFPRRVTHGGNTVTIGGSGTSNSAARASSIPNERRKSISELFRGPSQRSLNYNNKTAEETDERVAGWPLMESPRTGTIAVIIYLFVVWIGQKIMKNREPFSLKYVLIVYNFAMVALSWYLLWEFLMGGWGTGYSYGCQEVDYSNSPKALRMANVCWWFYFSKFIEMLDTVFFIMRKKNRQISFLHVFHHALMPFTWWIGVKFVAGGFGTFHAMLNSFIHFMMYIYYGVAGLGPAWQKYLWWKKYMTTMQLIQFFLVMVHSGQFLFIDCNYPPVFVWIIGSYGFIFFWLFLHFYIKNYSKSQRAAAKSTSANDLVTNGNGYNQENYNSRVGSTNGVAQDHHVKSH